MAQATPPDQIIHQKLDDLSTALTQQPGVADVQAATKSATRRHLGDAGDHALPWLERPEVRATLGQLHDPSGHRAVLLTGSAGLGKRGVTAQVVETLLQERWPVLAVRLDRLRPTHIHRRHTVCGRPQQAPHLPSAVLGVGAQPWAPGAGGPSTLPGFGPADQLDWERSRDPDLTRNRPVVVHWLQTGATPTRRWPLYMSQRCSARASTRSETCLSSASRTACGPPELRSRYSAIIA